MSSRRIFIIFLRSVGSGIILCLVLVLLATAYVVWAICDTWGYCVVLPNGYMIGHVSLWKRKEDPFWDMYLRDPAGKILVRSDESVDLARHPSNHERVIARFPGGIEMDLYGEEIMPVILHLNLAERRSKMFGDNVPAWHEESRLSSKGERVGLIRMRTAYAKLRRSGQFELVSCGTPWFDPGE